jgi:polar amino acid transport system substrate-binding protein
LTWLLEHHANEGFSGSSARGIGTGVWWSANTMFQRAGGADPLTVPGRIIATVWMIASVIAVAVFTAAWRRQYSNRSFLRRGRDGARNRRGRRAVVNVDQVQNGCVAQGRFPRATGRKGRCTRVRSSDPGLDDSAGQSVWGALTDMTFEPQSDAIVLQNDSAIRRQINLAPLDAEQSDWWKDTLFRYLGHAGG